MAVLTKITQRSLADNAVTSAHVQGDVIAAGDIAAGAIGTSELGADAVDGTKIADNAVNSEHVTAGAVDTAHIGDDQITYAKLQNLGTANRLLGSSSTGVIGEVQIATAMIAADAVDGTKLADNAVNSEHVAAGAIDTAHVGNDQITGAKIENNPTIGGNLSVTGDLVPATPLSHRNLIINGGMQVWQRATATTTVGWTYGTVDRWGHYYSINGAWTSEKYSMTLGDINTTGQGTALKLVCTGTDTIQSGEYAFLRQKIEGQNCQQLQYGTAAAKTMTLSFWVKTSKAGIYCVSIVKADSTQYSCPIEYTISAANTWQKITIPITPTAGSTSLITSAAGIINNDAGVGLEITFSLAMGTDRHGTNNTWQAYEKLSTSNQVNWFDSTSNNFYLTGVQLELGSNATPFEHRTYGEVLKICERYCKVYQGSEGMTHFVCNGGAGTSSQTNGYMNFKLETMPRATPTLTVTGQMRMSDHFATDKTANMTVGSNVAAGDLQGGRCYIQNWSGLYGARWYGPGFAQGTGDGTMKYEMEL